MYRYIFADCWFNLSISFLWTQDKKSYHSNRR